MNRNHCLSFIMQYMKKIHKYLSIFVISLTLFLLVVSCTTSTGTLVPTQAPPLQTPTSGPVASTPLPTRPVFQPGELVDYEAQTGDTLPALAAHFNTSIDEIRQANPVLPADVTTLPPGLPMEIPIYYQPLWGSPYHIIPDQLFINGPEASDFNTIQFVNDQPGWLKTYVDFPGGTRKVGGEIIDHVANNFSISPRLLLALLEYQAAALSQPTPPDEDMVYLLGFYDKNHQRLSQQLVLAANTLNNAYYGWRTGRLTSFEHLDGRLEQPDPWQNAASVALHYYFSKVMYTQGEYSHAIYNDGLLSVYSNLFGDPWASNDFHIPGSLTQPELLLPFEGGKKWSLTGGPHTGWGTGEPWAALDFAPAGIPGCSSTGEWATAVNDGIIAQTDLATVTLDLDGDGDERTGWTVIYLHLAANDMVKVGTLLKAGNPVGHPSCEGGSSTGTHIHISRKYNGEWISAAGALPFEMEGWVAQYGGEPYEGTLERFGKTIIANQYSDIGSQIEADNR